MSEHSNRDLGLVVRLNVQAMGREIAHHLTQDQVQLNKMIEEACCDANVSRDEIQKYARECVRQKIRRILENDETILEYLRKEILGDANVMKRLAYEKMADMGINLED